jgi:YD repeat-containing protein
VSSLGSPINFVVSALAPEAENIDWASQKAGLRPDFVPADAWDPIFGNFVTSAGSTTEQYNRMLAHNATYLSRLGIYTHDVSRLFGFELQQANAILPSPVAADAVDAELAAPGPPLTLSRVALQSIAGRHRLGPLGRGWVHNWEIAATTNSQGNVIIDQAGGRRVFIKQPDSTYRGNFGEFATLTLTAGKYRLREADGTILAFNSNGKLDFTEDSHGTRITAGYDGAGRLVSLTHSSGPALTLSYSTAGRLSSVADPAGRTVTYAYSGEHLATVTEQLTGALESVRTTAYSYVTGQGAAREHALASITNADGTHIFYQYDAQGRLVETHRDGGAEAISLSYDNDAGVTFTNTAGATTVLFNDVGRPELLRDPLGRTSQLDYDASFNLIKFASAGGNSYLYSYDTRGNLIRAVDPLGHATGYDPLFVWQQRRPACDHVSEPEPGAVQLRPVGQSDGVDQSPRRSD